MYYDLITSLPYLPHFTRADHLPITPLRLEQRLRRLSTEQAGQLDRARRLVYWRRDRLLGPPDAEIVREFSEFMDMGFDRRLREYVAFRMEQRTLMAALRWKQAQLELPPASNSWGAGPRVHAIRKYWDAPDFKLASLYPWLPRASERLAAGDARGLEQVLMDIAWRWLSQRAERNTFGFEAVFAYVFKWDILRAWLVCDVDRAKVRFTELIDQVTHAENN